MKLSIVMPYYRNPRMLARQLVVWGNEWSSDLRADVEIVIVDDGSPQEEAAADVVRAMPFRFPPISVYRVLEDRPWHQHAARNLGAHVAQASWLLLTDMDHVIPADTLGEVLRRIGAENGARVYTFARRDAPASEPWQSDHWSTMALTLNDRGELKPHVNSFAMPRKTYWKTGGYDEDFCGVYGTDRLFRDRLFKHTPQYHLSHFPLIRVSRDVIPDASTTTLPRKDGRAPDAKKAIHAAKAARGDAATIKVLQFPWERAL